MIRILTAVKIFSTINTTYNSFPAHSATEDATTEPDNVLLVRLIQQFHVESRKWDDIGYNFLIGCDGNVYEGRGWTAIGAHTYNFNKYSVGIAFVGCFINKTPPKAALANAKQLIAYGVKIGAIDEDYQLLAHCQCVTTASPGMMLYEEIKTWKNWAGDVNVDNPPIEVLNDRNLCWFFLKMLIEFGLILICLENNIFIRFKNKYRLFL